MAHGEERKMISWRKQLVPLIAAASLVLASGTVVDVASRAEEAILIPGATVLKPINPFYPLIALNYPKIGIHFHEDGQPLLIDYSQDALNSDKALLDGVQQTMIAVQQTDGKIVIIGESMGSMVAARVAKELAASPNPRLDDVRVVLIAPPEVGVAEYFKEGTFIPILNYRVKRVALSPYPTTIVIGEYDGWADPPDRPWNLLATANALLGIVYVHGVPSFTTDPNDVPPENVKTIPGNADHGPITTMLVPTKNLPLTQILRDIGVPDQWVDAIDNILRPIIDSAYVRNDKPGDSRPYLYNGEIRRNVETPQEVETPEADVAGGVETTDVDTTSTETKDVGTHNAVDGDSKLGIKESDTKDVTTNDTKNDAKVVIKDVSKDVDTEVVTKDDETTATDTDTDTDTEARAGDDIEKKKSPRETRRERRHEHRDAIRDGLDNVKSQVESGLKDLAKGLKGPRAKPKKAKSEPDTDSKTESKSESESE